VNRVVADLLKQESLPAFERRLRRYVRPDLLIIDELGYVTVRQPLKVRVVAATRGIARVSRARDTVGRVPTLLVTEGFRFFFYSNEGSEPRQVHVEYADGTAKFWLQPVALAEVYDIKRQALRQARLLVEQHQASFLEKWNEYFGS
jgi:hypothetical protein